MYTQEELQSKSLSELKEIGWQLDALPDGDRRLRQNWIRAIEQATEQAGDRTADEFLNQSTVADDTNLPDASQESIAQATEKSLDVDRVQEPLESKFGRIVYPRPAAQIEQEMTQSAIEPVAEYCSGVEVDRRQEPKFQVGDVVRSLSITWGFEKESLTGIIISVRPPGCSGVRVDVGSGGTFDFSRSQLGDLIVDRAQEPLESNGRIVYPRPAAKIEPEMSQSAIGQAAENSPGVTQAQEPIECSADGHYFQEPDGRRYRHIGSRRFYIIEPTMQEAVNTNVYGEPDYPEWPDGWLSEPESGQNPILTTADSWDPADFGDVLHKAEADGQLNLLEWEVSEPPDPDDYDLMTDFHAAYDRWLLSSELEEIIHAKNEPTIEGTDTQCERASEMPRNNCVPSECDSGSYRDGAHVDRPHGLEFGKEGDLILAISRNGEGDSGRDLSRKLAQLAPIIPPQAPIIPPQAAKKSPGVGVDLKIGMLVGRRSDRQHIGKILNIYQSRRGIWRAKIQPLNKSNFVYFDCATLIEQRLLYDYEMKPGGFFPSGSVFDKTRGEKFEVYSRKVRSSKPTNWTAGELTSLSIFKLKQIARDMEIPAIPGTAGKRSLIRAILAEQAISQEKAAAQRERETGRAMVQKQTSAPIGNKKRSATSPLVGNQLSLFDVAV